MRKFRVIIEGIAPLMQARHPSPAEEKEILMRKSGAKAKVKELTDKEAYEMRAYRTKSGKYFQPSDMLEAAMAKAAVNFKLEGKKTYKDLIKSGVLVSPAEIVHKYQEFEMDTRWGRNSNTGGAVWVVRPRIDDWSLEFDIDLLQDERISPEILKEILEYAGLYVAIGAWRPKFGRFTITSFKEITK